MTSLKTEKGYGVLFAVLIIALLALTTLSFVIANQRREANVQLLDRQVKALAQGACNPGSDNCHGPRKLEDRRSPITGPIVARLASWQPPRIIEDGRVRPKVAQWGVAALVAFLLILTRLAIGWPGRGVIK